MASSDSSSIEQLPDQESGAVNDPDNMSLNVVKSTSAILPQLLPQLRSVSAPAIISTPQRIQPSRLSKTRARRSWDSDTSLYYDPNLDFELSPINGYTPTGKDKTNYPDSYSLDRNSPGCIQNSGFLLTLSAEVRCMIYDFVFDERPVCLRLKIDSDNLDKEKPLRKKGCRPTNSTALLRVCRQVATEARAVYYDETTFHFWHHNRGAEYTPGKGLRPRNSLWELKSGDMRKVDYSFLPYLPLRQVHLSFERYLNLSMISFFVDNYPELQHLGLSMRDYGTCFVNKHGDKAWSIKYTAREFADSQDIQEEIFGVVLNTHIREGVFDFLGFEESRGSHDKLYTVARYLLRKWEREGRENKPRIVLEARMPKGWCREVRVSPTIPERH
jgi:hypothetical protein